MSSVHSLTFSLHSLKLRFLTCLMNTYCKLVILQVDMYTWNCLDES